jgi:hypothetical protein
MTGTAEKSSPERCATTVIFKPLPEVNNNQLGENAKIRPTWSPWLQRQRCKNLQSYY